MVVESYYEQAADITIDVGVYHCYLCARRADEDTAIMCECGLQGYEVLRYLAEVAVAVSSSDYICSFFASVSDLHCPARCVSHSLTFAPFPLPLGWRNLVSSRAVCSAK